MSRRKVLVKRLVCIEDLGDIDVLFTDKTGTLTVGRIDYARAVPVDGQRSEDVLRWGLLCTENVPGGARRSASNPLDQALWDSPATAVVRRVADRARRCSACCPSTTSAGCVSVVVRDRAGRLHARHQGSARDRARTVRRRADRGPAPLCDAEFAAGNRVVAVASRPVATARAPEAADEHDLQLRGLLVFLDPPKPDAAAALGRLATLGIRVKVVTGDNAVVAAKVCRDLGLPGDAGAHRRGPRRPRRRRTSSTP